MVKPLVNSIKGPHIKIIAAADDCLIRLADQFSTIIDVLNCGDRLLVWTTAAA